MFTFIIETKGAKDMIDITKKVQQHVKEFDVINGIAHIFIPHTTAAITINENSDPDVISDMLMFFDRLSPKDSRYKHAEGNSDAHILSSLVGSSLQIIIENGRLQLGTWQGIFFCEFDGPRNRKVFIKINQDT